MVPMSLEQLQHETEAFPHDFLKPQIPNSFYGLAKFSPASKVPGKEHYGVTAPILVLLPAASNRIESGKFNMDYVALSSTELVRACAQTGRPLAWQEFIRRFNPLIAGVAIRTARRWGNFPLSLIDDLVQDTYLKLCADNYKLLRTFEPREPE